MTTKTLPTFITSTSEFILFKETIHQLKNIQNFSSLISQTVYSFEFEDINCLFKINLQALITLFKIKAGSKDKKMFHLQLVKHFRVFLF